MNGDPYPHRTRVSISSGLVLAGALLLLPGIAQAQTWRTVELSRQLRDTAAHEVRVRYDVGRFTIGPAEEPLLYEAYIRYDEDRSTPAVTYDPESRALVLEMRRTSDREVRTKGQGELRLALSRRAPIDLALELGAVEADIALGGIPLNRLRIDVGASRSAIDFDRPNTVVMRSLELHSGAAGLRATGLANARASEMRVAAGVGSVDLDFGGTWTQDLEASIDIAIGRVRMRIPPHVGVRVEMSRFLTKFDHPDFERRGNLFVSRNWDSAEHRLSLRVNTAFGSVSIDRGGD
ncbi:MAG TPA: LiaF domain-containing protein [Gemmatimonadaceae bacterium]|nr:LiaF domain-containing protein [Gemmatimonadaceae bacterium]